MKKAVKYRSSAMVLFIILLCILFLTKCINNQKDNADKAIVSNYKKYAGAASCVSCHKEISNSHLNTAHFHTSEIASEKNIKGNFDEGKNTFLFNNGGLIAMQKINDEFFQAGFEKGNEIKREKFDIVIGSGTKGQTCLSWVGTQLVHLPITYFTEGNQWCNSPGYPDKISFNRPITSRCLECHMTYAEKLSEPMAEPVAIDKSKMIMGVTCEKCHGPAQQHVDFQTQHPKETKAAFIINPAKLTRQQSLDMCALCHGGRLQKTKPSFEFTAGNKLTDYFKIDSVSQDAASIDVHGNQYGLLAASKCFKVSNTLTCNTCHNSHEKQTGNTALFSQKCTTCHNSKHQDAVICKMTASIGSKINEHCTACHMPQKPSMAIAVLLQGSLTPTPALMHTHFIKAYPEETQKVLAYIKNKSPH